MEIKQALAAVVEGQNLTQAEMADVMRAIMSGQATEAQIGGFLVALRIKGESVEEITGAAQVMRQLASPVAADTSRVVDTCGTGGDGAHLFNISTASAFVVAAAGGAVAKHGNRSVTSSTGSADVLEAAGVNLAIDADQVARCIREVGVGFMFAPAHHGAMKHAIGPRRELGLRTIFNVLGPLTNPAGAKRQVVGVFRKDLCRTVAEVLQRLGSTHVLVVHAADGLDEISLSGETWVAELRADEIREYTIAPEDFDLQRESIGDLVVASAEESLQLIRDALKPSADSRAQKAARMIAINAGAALYVTGMCDTLRDAVSVAEDVISTGAALDKLTQLAEFTTCMKV